MITRLAAVFSTVFIAVIALTGHAWSQSGLLVTPQLIQFEDRERSKTLTLVNRSTEPQLYRINLVNRMQHPNGSMEPIEEPPQGETFADPYIRLSPRQILLPPGEPQTIRFMIRAPSDLPEGEYRSHILLQQVPRSTEEPTDADVSEDELGISVQAVFGVTLPIIFHRGDVGFEPTVEVTNVGIDDSGSPRLGVRLSTEGNRHLRGDLYVFNAEEERIGLLRSAAVYISTKYRDMSIPLTELPEQYLRVELREHEGDEVLTEHELRIE